MNERQDGFSGGGARMPARSVCLVTLFLSEAGPGRFGGQVSVTDIYHAIPYCRSYPGLPRRETQCSFSYRAKARRER